MPGWVDVSCAAQPIAGPGPGHHSAVTVHPNQDRHTPSLPQLCISPNPPCRGWWGGRGKELGTRPPPRAPPRPGQSIS